MLDTALQNLARHVGRPLPDFLADEDEQWVVERGLHICAQNVLDIATHLAASAGHDAPDYASSIDVLARLGILPAAFARQLRPVAGFRNILVHGYLEVDLTRVHEFLNTRIDDFREFARHVGRYLDSLS